ncbi:MAG: hypothetical protein NT151_10615 [Acidobacteria bacterium]|nr:hypothetical protein [Acidobacteriota bacterium]
MSHLAPEDVVDVLDGCARRHLVRHAESCEACRALVEDARHATLLASTDEIPEPSPLFWTPFSTRVGESVRRAPAPERSWAGLSWVWRAVPVGSAIVLVALVGLTQWQNSHQPQPPAAGAAAVPVVIQVEPQLAFPDNDEPWALISQVMADVAADEMSAADMPATIGSADRALESLTEAEKAELARLLKAEMDEPGVSP